MIRRFSKEFRGGKISKKDCEVGGFETIGNLERKEKVWKARYYKIWRNGRRIDGQERDQRRRM